MQCYIPDYPRPQFVRDDASWKNLNGSWDFAFDDLNEGTEQKWFLHFPPGKSIIVPFTCETEMSGIGDPKPHDCVWYHTVFNAVGGGRRLFLHFEGSDYATGVWINGAYAGSHEGGYSRFSFDITELVQDGENSLTVRVRDRYDMSQPRGKQHWKDREYGCWYTQSTGIWKTVWLEYVPTEHISRIKMTPVFNEKKLGLEADISAPPGAGLALEVSVSLEGRAISAITVPVFKERLSLCIDIFSAADYEWGVHTWSPEHPALYDISFRLLKNGTALDTVLSYFGMREIRIDGGTVLLNGIPLYQRLILDQGYWKKSHLTPPDELNLPHKNVCSTKSDKCPKIITKIKLWQYNLWPYHAYLAFFQDNSIYF
jgi:beta-galactosidase/beta-glucuronidase